MACAIATTGFNKTFIELLTKCKTEIAAVSLTNFMHDTLEDRMKSPHNLTWPLEVAYRTWAILRTRLLFRNCFLNLCTIVRLNENCPYVYCKNR